MARYTSNYAWAMPEGSDPVDITVPNNNLASQDSTIHDAFLNMAPPFSESSTYAVDDIVLYGTGLYKCHTAVVTPGSWTGTTNWQTYKLSEGGSGGGGGEVKNLDNGMLSHSTDSAYITVNLDVALSAGKEYRITLRDPAYNYIDSTQIVWQTDVDVIFAGNGGGPYKIRLTQTTVSLYNYSGTGWRNIYCDIVSDFITTDAGQIPYGNSNVKEALDERITTDDGTFTDASSNTYTGVTVDMLSYDATNQQLLMKVDGADSVIPFKRPKISIGTFISASTQYGIANIDYGFEPDFVIVSLPFSAGDTTSYWWREASWGAEKAIWELRPTEQNTYVNNLGRTGGETGIQAINSNGFSFMSNGGNTRGVTCKYFACKYIE